MIQQLQFYAHGIERIDTHIVNKSNPKAKIANYRCVLRIKVNDWSEVIIEDEGDDIYKAINKAFTRARRTLERRLLLHNQNQG